MALWCFCLVFLVAIKRIKSKKIRLAINNRNYFDFYDQDPRNASGLLGVEKYRISAPMSAERKNAAVSIMLDLYKRSKTRAKSLGFTTWSAYVVQLIRADVSGGGNIIVQETAETPDVPARREATYEMPKKSHGARR